MKDGHWEATEAGTPQGGVASLQAPWILGIIDFNLRRSQEFHILREVQSAVGLEPMLASPAAVGKGLGSAAAPPTDGAECENNPGKYRFSQIRCAAQIRWAAKSAVEIARILVMGPMTRIHRTPAPENFPDFTSGTKATA